MSPSSHSCSVSVKILKSSKHCIEKWSNPGLLHCRRILYQLSHRGSPRILELVAYAFSSGSSWPRNQTGVSHIAGGFFTNWAEGSPKFFEVKVIQLYPTIWSMRFSRQEYWSGSPFPSPGDLSDPGIEPRSPTLQADSLPAEPQGKPPSITGGFYWVNTWFPVLCLLNVSTFSVKEANSNLSAIEIDTCGC